jgi:hypothetical protein
VDSNLRLWVVKPEVGNWYLRPVGEEEPRSIKVDQVVCRECYGSKTSISPDNETIECPTCRGKGSIPSDQEQKVALYRFRIIKSTIKTYSQANLREFSIFEQDIEPLNQTVTAYINDTKTNVRLAREEHEQERRETAERKKKEEAEKAEKQKLMAAAEQNYVWLTGATAVRRNIEPIPGFKVKSTHELDDYNFPSTFDNRPVSQFTDWIKISPKSRDLVGQKYRLLKLGESGDSPIYFIQYQFSYVNTGGTPMDFTTDITIKFNNVTEEKWSDTYENILPSWSGFCFGANELSVDKLIHAIDEVSIDLKQ